MTVTDIRVYVEPPKGNAEEAVDNWVSNYSKWDGESEYYGLSPIPDDISGDYLSGFWKFEDDLSDPRDFLWTLKDRLSGFQDGLAFRATMHVCEHDDPRDDNNCSPEYATEYGDVPSGVPPIPDGAEVV